MKGAGIETGDILVVDRSLQPESNDVCVCILDDAFTVKRVSKSDGKVYLFPENPTFKPLLIEEWHNFQVWGVVTHVVKSMRRKK
jgi:DNA polymerase V